MQNKLILLLIALVAVTCKADSKVAYYEVNFVELNTAIKLYFLDCGNYPNSLLELNERKLCKKWELREYKKLDLKDFWGREFMFSVLQKDGVKTKRYLLTSYGEDGLKGTTDDISNDIDPVIWRLYYNSRK